MIPYTDDLTGLRDWRSHVAPRARRWPWMLLIVGVSALIVGASR